MVCNIIQNNLLLFTDMMEGIVIGGLLLGAVSSLHCAGMCGPLILSLPIQQYSRSGQVTAMLLYNGGRVVTYTAMGLLFGIAGRHIYLAGFQQWLSIFTGIIVLVLASRYFLHKHIGVPVWAQSFYAKVLQWMHRFINLQSNAGYLLLGMMNGVLPCGMVYLALAGALSNTGIIQSGLFMFAFGTGTLPVMLTLSLYRVKMNMQVRLQFKQLLPYITAAMGIILILRGMNLGIPFISPVLAGAPSESVSCH